MDKNRKLNKNKETVFVGMSGGVDSSVSAVILKNQGYHVVGVFIRTWHPDFLTCNEEQERRDAMRVCAHLNIPFLTFDFEEIYKKDVADYMISEYRKGRTPNPDVMCNKYVKFGAFLEKAISMGADYVATGHYAQNVVNKNFKKILSSFSHSNLNMVNEHDLAYEAESTFYNFFLVKGIDALKDQSYFLWTLRQEQLSKILFPVGNLNKSEVRKLAKKFDLPVAEKKDSQGICFLGEVDLREFLKHYIKEKRGKVFLIENEQSEEIGHHEGVVFYTLGERHGFVVNKKKPNDKPYYVVGKDVEKNILYVSQDKDYSKVGKSFNIFTIRNENTENQNDIFNFSLFLENVNWISGIPKRNKKYTTQIRYHGEFFPCKIKITGDDKAEVMFKKQILVASGQSLVFYDKNICIGGGVII